MGFLGLGFDRRGRQMVVCCGLLSALPAAAQTAGPDAIVENLVGRVAGVEVFDYLERGRKLTLPADATITLGYLRSCIQETVRGGSLVIGESESTVADGAKVERVKTACDGAKLILTVEQAGKSGVVVFRAPTEAGGRKLMSEPDLILHGRSPLVDAAGAAKLVIERLDVAGERWEIELKGQPAPGERFFDCARKDIVLSLGGTYRIGAGGRELIVRIHPFAVAGSAPVVARLVRL